VTEAAQSVQKLYMVNKRWLSVSWFPELYNTFCSEKTNDVKIAVSHFLIVIRINFIILNTRFCVPEKCR